MKKTPVTIADLEAILSCPDEPEIYIRPDGSILAATQEDGRSIPWPDPTPEMLNDPEFNAIWNCIKTWDVNVPGAYSGYCEATGNHVRAILDALKSQR